jgi:8-oxo-dGTP pyrophosphatase MutT (NUDIX family)
MSSTASSIDAITTAADLAQRLAAVLAACRPNWAITRRFAPDLSYGRHFGPAPAMARPAAVIALLFRRGGRWHVPLTERPTELVRHGGQISLPGGTLEPGESVEQAALRELDEELGFRGAVASAGRLSECYVYASDYVVAPCVVTTDEEPDWRPQAGEVNCVIELPLASLLDATSISQMTIERGPVVFRAPCYRFDGPEIWGATSIMLGELAGVLRQLVES